MGFGQRLEAAYLAKYKDRAEFARAIGKQHHQVSGWVKGKVPDLENLKLVAVTLGTSIDWLLFGDAPPRLPPEERAALKERTEELIKKMAALEASSGEMSVIVKGEPHLIRKVAADTQRLLRQTYEDLEHRSALRELVEVADSKADVRSWEELDAEGEAASIAQRGIAQIEATETEIQALKAEREALQKRIAEMNQQAALLAAERPKEE